MKENNKKSHHQSHQNFVPGSVPKRCRLRFLTLIPLFVFMPLISYASSKPLWEVGVFAAAARIPHYPGSDEYRDYALPFPYIIYRGKFFQAGREGVKGIFYRDRRIETNISLSGNPPVYSDNNAREGMPEKDGLFEIGPSLKYFFNGRENKNPFLFKTSVRLASSVNFDEGIGFTYQGLRYEGKVIHANTTLLKPYLSGFSLSSGVSFASKMLNEYYYDVDRPFVTPARHYYKAKGGYSGLSVATSIHKNLSRRFSIGAYGRWSNILGTGFEKSPLVKEENNYTVGVALTWRIFFSRKKAPCSTLF